MTTASAPFYAAEVEATAASAFAPTIPNGSLTRVTDLVRRELDEVKQSMNASERDWQERRAGWFLSG